MASQMTRNRRGRTKHKKYDGAVPGSCAQKARRGSNDQFWCDHLGNGYRYRREALAANRRAKSDKLPIMKRF